MRLPQSVGGYRLIELIGSGSFGTVYRAEIEGAMGFTQDVALKLLDPARAGDQPELVASLADEAALLSRIQHPNIVQVRGFERIEHDFLGTTYAMVMELVKGLPLRRLIDSATERGLRFPIHACLLVVAEAAEALQYAHEMAGNDGRAMGLVHRDMKPANMLVTKYGRLKILDFGIAWASERQVSSTAAGMTKGTVLYMSPEQIRGLPLDGRSDIYSLGLIFYEMLTGEFFVPLPEGGLSDIAGMLRKVAETTWDERVAGLRQVLRAEAPEGHGLDEGQAVFIETLLGEMLCADPEQRADAARIVLLLDELDVAWRIKQGRGFLKDLVVAEYETWERIPVMRDGPSTTMEPISASSLTPLPDGRTPGGSRPVAETRLVESSGAAEEEIAAPAVSGPAPGGSAPGVSRDVDLRIVALAVFGFLLLIVAVGLLLRDGGSVADGGSAADGVVLAPMAPEPAVTEPPVDGLLVADDDDSAEAVADSEEPPPEEAPTSVDPVDEPTSVDPVVEEPTAAPPPRQEPLSRPDPRPVVRAPDPTPAPAPEPTPARVAEVMERARVRMNHSPPRFVVPGSPLTLEVTIKTLSMGSGCEPRLILAPKKRRRFKRYDMQSRGEGRWTASVDVPYDEEWAGGVRYFLECCWDDDCDERWKSPVDPQYVYPPDF